MVSSRTKRRMERVLNYAKSQFQNEEQAFIFIVTEAGAQESYVISNLSSFEHAIPILSSLLREKSN